jgi:formyl-CoA transferase
VSRPLEGVRVLDISRMVTGPVACYYLAALGAEVVRVEPPGGDPTWSGPPFVGPAGVHAGPRTADDISLAPLRRQRGKRSVVVDLHDERGRAIVLQLAAWADVLVENFRPGYLAARGLDREALAAANPRLVHCAVTGFGHTGPYRDLPAMDLVVQAMSGLMAKTGFPDGPPTKSGVMIGDQVPTLFAVIGILAALRQRDRDGRGRFVDVSMMDSLLQLVWDEPVDHYERAGMAPRSGNTDLRAGPIGAFATLDGHVTIVLTTEEHWQRLCAEMDRPDLAVHTRTTRRGALLQELVGEVAAWCRTRSTADVLAAFRRTGAPSGTVEPPAVGRTDPHVAERASLEELRYEPAGGATGFLGPTVPFHISDAEIGAAPAERLGTSTDAVLAELCGLSSAELAALRADGVIA